VCLGIPGKVVAIEGEPPLRMAKVDFGGVRRRVSLAYVPEAEVGDYCIVHVGFAISKVDEAEALRTRQVLEDLALAEDVTVGLEQEEDGP
jgi:hydrogenase expression/formation protein HypC